MATQRCLWEDAGEKKRHEGPESRDLTWKIMREIWTGQCASEASWRFQQLFWRSGQPGAMNKGNGIKAGEAGCLEKCSGGSSFSRAVEGDKSPSF